MMSLTPTTIALMLLVIMTLVGLAYFTAVDRA
jgi:hypothetical protein